ncbi:cucumber peeling cupredoxin-like [Chenopodium quinoa]|uniref:Phytocyanin domain-containing protein n=1 Tax=Chenopodium quinoa TaxID=63459 RepID=A0A803KYZ4_CHEQI|nr:cucumber peeling cupredoxin-like [Chenopodium quinoa]
MAAIMAAVIYITAVIGVTSAVTYTNHTVGGPPPSGWYFNSSSNISSTNYSSWAASQTFNLGDYLIFNTNTNQTVIQTYNSNTYNNCTSDDSSDNNTLVFNSGATKFGQPLTISVPLTKVGPNYFFSDAEDGVQCQRGMRFDIKVGQGLGLPPSLNQPPPPLYSAPPMAEPPPAFQGSGGGQGESMYNGVEGLTDGIFGVAVIWAGLIVLGLGFVF